jgi:hypothetical protein
MFGPAAAKGALRWNDGAARHPPLGACQGSCPVSFPTLLWVVAPPRPDVALPREGFATMPIGTFNERIAIAIDLLAARFPKACLHLVEGEASTGPTTTPMAIDRMKLVFRNDDGMVLVVEETGYGVFGPLRRLDPPPALGPAIRWPVEMDLPEADNLKEQAACIDAYATVRLRAGSSGAAEFVFGGNPACADVVVRTVDGTVY